MGVPVLALFRENKIRESQYYCHSRNLNPSKFMPYTVSQLDTFSDFSSLSDQSSVLTCMICKKRLRSAHPETAKSASSTGDQDD